MERKLGEIFEYKGKRLQIAGNLECRRCHFEFVDLDGTRSCSKPDELGSCSNTGRSDGNSIIFKLIED